MRILFLIPNMAMGGAQRVMSHLVNYCAKTHEVALAVLDPDTSAEFFFVDPRVKRYCLDVLGGQGISRMLRVLSRLWKIRTLQRTFRPDVVVSFMDTMNTAAILALAGSGVPLIAAERTDPASGSIGRLRGWLRNRTYRHAIIVVQTRRVAKYFAKIGIEAHVIANPVTIPDVTAEPHRAGSDDRFCIVACGRLSREKRIPLLIEAFARLASKYPEWYVLLLGDGPEREAIASLVNRRGLRQRVVFAGAVADAQSAMAACHIFAFTSAYEGFPNALAEAMAVGLPSLACCGVSGVEDLVLDQRTGLLADLEPSVEDLAAKLETLMRGRSLRQRLGTAARGHVINWAPDVILSKWDYLLEQVCATNNGPAVHKNSGPPA